MQTQTVDAFYKTFNRVPEKRRTLSLRFEAPVGATLAELLATYIAAGGTRGSHETGVFEMQTDAGIWSHRDEKRMDASTARRAASCEFKTWEELDAE